MTDQLAGKRILVVEDEYFIAADLKRALTEAAAIVVGPVGRLDAALTLIDREQVDAAVLDVNLEGAMTYPIADRLAADAVPWVFVTGYDDWALPDAYRDAPRLPKPFTATAVVDCVNVLIATRAST